MFYPVTQKSSSLIPMFIHLPSWLLADIFQLGLLILNYTEIEGSTFLYKVLVWEFQSTVCLNVIQTVVVIY